VELFSDLCQSAPKIAYLPTPERSLKGFMPFNPKQGAGSNKSVGKRALLALPLLLPSLIACRMIWNDG
jgi:hypothetical protein